MPSHSRIRDRRIALGLRQEDLAERLKRFWPSIDRLTITKIEGGRRIVRADELPWFAEALECDVQDLVDPVK